MVPCFASSLVKSGSPCGCLPLGSWQEGKEEVLGTGMHGAVLVAKHRKSGRRVAAKCLEASDSGLPEEAGFGLRILMFLCRSSMYIVPL